MLRPSQLVRPHQPLTLDGVSQIARQFGHIRLIASAGNKVCQQPTSLAHGYLLSGCSRGDSPLATTARKGQADKQGRLLGDVTRHSIPNRD